MDRLKTTILSNYVKKDKDVLLVKRMDDPNYLVKLSKATIHEYISIDAAIAKNIKRHTVLWEANCSICGKLIHSFSQQHYSNCEEHRRQWSDNARRGVSGTIGNLPVEGLVNATYAKGQAESIAERCQLRDGPGCGITHELPNARMAMESHHIIARADYARQLIKDHPEMSTYDAVKLINATDNVMYILTSIHRGYHRWIKRSKPCNQETLNKYIATYVTK